MILASYDMKLVQGEEIVQPEGEVEIGIPIPAKSAPAKKASGVFARLLAAGERLMGVIRRNEGGANKDLAKFADQINALCDKWDR